MADGKLVPEFHGSDRGITVVEWVEKAELVYDLCGKVERQDVGRVGDFFGTDPFVAHDRLFRVC